MKKYVQELISNGTDCQILSWYPVVVKEFGSEGLEPQDKEDCPLGGGISCVSGSGGSMCSNYIGAISDKVIRCAVADKEKA